jgi:hypothetical protein
VEEGRRWRKVGGGGAQKERRGGRRIIMGGEEMGTVHVGGGARRVGNAGKSAPVGGGRLFDGASFESGVALERAEWRVALGERAEWRGVELPVPAVMLSGVDACVWIAWA